jgi:anti-anti-sigma factor
MELRLHVGEPVKGCKLVRVTGEVDLDNVGEFERAIRQCLRERPDAILVDLSKADYVSGAGLDVLLACAANLGVMGSRLTLVGPQPAVCMALDLVGLFDLASVAATVSEAVRSLFGTQAVKAVRCNGAA